MNCKELMLRTIFACMACDGDIATEEIQLLRGLIVDTDLFVDMDVELTLKHYVDDINRNGVSFLNQYLSEVGNGRLSEEDQLQLIDLAFKTIEANNCIEYSEVKFFKKIRARLSVSDEEILARHPGKEVFLLQDINVTADLGWENMTFSEISLKVV